MGFIPATGFAKIFEGNAQDPSGNNISDFNSIQSAVKGTSSTPANVTKNFATIVNNAKLDMFVPKRTTLPNSTGQFRSYPRRTFTISNIDAFFIDNGSNYDVTFSLVLIPNWFVGFNQTLRIEAAINLDLGTEQQIDVTWTTGQSDNRYIEITWDNVSPSTSGGSEIDITYSVFVQSTSPFADLNAYFEPAPTGTIAATDNTLQPPAFPNGYLIYPIGSLSCGASVTGSAFTAFSNVSTLGNNAPLYTDNQGTTNIVTGNYAWIDTANNIKYIFLASANFGNGTVEINNYTSCGAGSGGFG
jgi:hypothetical protein